MSSHNCIVLALMVTAAALILLTRPSAGVEWENFTEADGLIHSTEKTLKDAGDAEVSADEKQKIEDAIAALKEALKNTDKDDIEAKMKALTEASHSMAEKMYAKANAQGAQADTADAAGEAKAEDAKADDVVDAEFEEVDDNDKKS